MKRRRKDCVVKQIETLVRKIRKRNKDRVIALWIMHLKALFDAIRWRIDKE